MIRAGASNRDMVRGLGIDIRRLYRVVFAGGVALAALAGMIAAPLSSVYPGMGGSVLIICFVVVVIGGIGSITGALIASLLVGFVDTFGKVFFAEWSGVGVYLLMAIVLHLAARRADEACRLTPHSLRGQAGDRRTSPRCQTSAGANRRLGRSGGRGRRDRRPAVLRLAVRAGPDRQHRDLRDLRAQPRAARRRDRPGEPGPCGLPRHRRLRDGARLRATAARPLPVLLVLAVGSAALYARWSARSACARAASTSSWSRWRSRRWPTSSSTTPRLGGGSDGIFLYVKPVLRSAASCSRPRRAACTSTTSCSAALAGTYAFIALLLRSRFGHALAGIRVNEQRMRAAGFSTYAATSSPPSSSPARSPAWRACCWR